MAEINLGRVQGYTPENNGASHNAIYRGEDITELFYNGTLSEQISAGTFDDIFIGDYIIGKESGRKYLVADINYRLGTSNNDYSGGILCTTPHVLMIPEKIMGNARMNSSRTSSGGYANSEMFKNNILPYRNIIKSDFGTEHILHHSNLFVNATQGDRDTGGAWFTTDIDLMNEIMVYGTHIFNGLDGNDYPYTLDKTQLSLFRYDSTKILAYNDNNERDSYWLRDIHTSESFTGYNFTSYPFSNGADYSMGIRPAFLVY